jgi:hypothetical protein
MLAALIHLVIYIIVVGVIVWLLLYLNDTIPVPEPFHKVVRIVVIVVGVLIVILALLSLVGVDYGLPRVVR